MISAVSKCLWGVAVLANVGLALGADINREQVGLIIALPLLPFAVLPVLALVRSARWLLSKWDKAPAPERAPVSLDAKTVRMVSGGVVAAMVLLIPTWTALEPEWTDAPIAIECVERMPALMPPSHPFTCTASPGTPQVDGEDNARIWVVAQFMSASAFFMGLGTATQGRRILVLEAEEAERAQSALVAAVAAAQPPPDLDEVVARVEAALASASRPSSAADALGWLENEKVGADRKKRRALARAENAIRRSQNV